MLSDITKVGHPVTSEPVVPWRFNTLTLGAIDGIDCINCIETNYVRSNLDYRPILAVECFYSLCSTASHVHEEREEATSLAVKGTRNISKWRQVKCVNELAR